MKEQVYEIRLGETSSAIIEYTQTEFMAKVFELVNGTKLTMDELEITKTK